MTENHPLQLKVCDKSINKQKTGDIINISVKDYLQLSPLKQRALCFYKNKALYKKRKTEIPPYILGIWLGDGSHGCPSVCNIDEEVITEWCNYINSIGLNIRKDEISYFATTNVPGKRNEFIEKLKYYSLFKNKHIPRAFLINSLENRLELLAGLIDTDGNIIRNSSKRTSGYEITQVRKQLAEQIVLLVNSVGLNATLKIKYIKEKPYYRVFIFGEINIIPCRIKRKKAGIPSYHKNRRNPLHIGFELKYIGKQEFFGFELDGNNLFLLHDNIVQHNCTEINAYTRWNIVKPTLLDGIDIIGKSIHTTTVEELERKGGRAALEMWHDSDPIERKADGRTKSGLYRYFKPAYYGLRGYIDDYGYSDVEGAKEYLTKQRESLKGEKLADEIRKYPFTPHEAFMSATSGGIFPDHRINDQLMHNSTLTSNMVRRGNFVWTNTNRTAADFFDDPNGRCLVAWMPPPELRNRHEILSNGISPLNSHLGGIGVDPFDIDTTVNKKRSDGAIYVFRRFDSLAPFRSYCYSLEYVCRPELADIFFEDVAKICVFYGMKALIEDTKPACIKKLKEWGLSNYISKTRQDEFSKTTSRNWRDGISTTGQGAREEMMNGLVLYTHKHIGIIEPKTQIEFYGVSEENVILDLYGFCPFEHLLEDLKQFDVNKWTDYDATVAASLALMQAHRTKIVEVKDGIALTTLFPTFDNSGIRSKRN